MISGKSLFSGFIPRTKSNKKEELVDTKPQKAMRDISSATAATEAMDFSDKTHTTNASDDIVTRFENYFALFDGRTNVEPAHYAKVRRAVAALFDESVLEEQLELAEELLEKQTIIKVNNIEKCRSSQRVHYHLRVATRRNANVRQHISGFASLTPDESKVTTVETKVKVIQARGNSKKRIGGLSVRRSSRVGISR